jgi:hypothetical protein
MTEMTKMLMSRKFVVCIPAESGGTIVNCSAVQSLNGEVQLTKAHAIDVRTLAKVFEGVSQIQVWMVEGTTSARMIPVTFAYVEWQPFNLSTDSNGYAMDNIRLIGAVYGAPVDCRFSEVPAHIREVL